MTPDGAREIGAEPDASKNARDDTRLHARFGNRSPEPAVYRVLLDGQNPAGLSRRPQYGVRVERLHSVHAQHSTGNATDPQLVGGGERDAEDATSGDEREVLALPKSTRASELKGLIRAACIGRRRLVESEVRGSRGIRDCFGGLRGLPEVAGCHHRDLGKGAEYREIFGGVMRHAERAVTEPAADRDDFHVGVVIASIVANLLKTSKRRKIRNGVGENDATVQC